MPPPAVQIYGLVWPWPLTSWSPKLTVSCRCHVTDVCQLASKSVSFVFNISRSQVCNRQTNERTDGQTSWEHYIAACVSGLAKAWHRITTRFSFTCQGVASMYAWIAKVTISGRVNLQYVLTVTLPRKTVTHQTRTWTWIQHNERELPKTHIF